MDQKEIARRLFSDPDNFFKFLESKHIDINGLKELDLPRLFIRKQYKEFSKQENFEATEAVYWISYSIERDLGESILFVETRLGKSQEEVDTMLDTMYFGDKIEFVKKNYGYLENHPYVEFLRSVKKLRNDVAHGRIGGLQYASYSMADVRGQMKLTIDWMNALRSK